jgi:hypothetical protein
VGRIVLFIMLAATLWYLWASPGIEADGMAFLAMCPVGLLTVSLWRGTRPNADALHRLALAGAGAAVTTIPVLLYHVLHGSLGAFAHDTLVAGFNETRMPFFGGGAWYLVLAGFGLYNTLLSFDPVMTINGFYWTVLTLAGLANGARLLARIVRRGWHDDLALPAIATFYALVSLYLEGPMYLYYSAGLSIVAVLWQLKPGRLSSVLGSTSAALVAFTAIVFHAGQPFALTGHQTLNGTRLTQFHQQVDGPDRSGFRMSVADRDTYSSIVRLIQQHSQPGDEIFAFPNDAELYFLANRRNPVRYYNSALGLQRPGDLQATIDRLDRATPRVVLFRPADKYNNDASARLIDVVRQRYIKIDTIAGLEVYVPVTQ